MLDNTYKSMINQVLPSEDLVEHVSLLMKSELEKSTTKNRYALRKPITIALICVCIVLSVPVMASTVPLLNKILYKVAAEVTHFLQPIELSSQDNGIKMDVLAAMNDEDMAVVYLTLQDLTGKRFDDTLDLYNYSIQGYRSFTHEVVNFDNDTNIATIRMIANGGEKLNGKKISLNLQSFLSNKIEYKDIPLDIDMNEISDAKTILLDMENIPGGSGPGFDKLYEERMVNVLMPISPKIEIDEIDFVSISGIGYENGLLHIQTDWKESVDNHGYIFLKDKAENEILPYANISFGIDENRNTIYGRRYDEYMYQIPREELSNYKAYGYFVENGSYNEGDWKVTFKLDAVDSRSIEKNNLQINGIKITKLTVTPLGIQVVGKDEAVKNLDVEVINNDGEAIAYDSVITNSEDGIFKSKYIAELPVDIDMVKEIKINGVVVFVYISQ